MAIIFLVFSIFMMSLYFKKNRKNSIINCVNIFCICFFVFMFDLFIENYNSATQDLTIPLRVMIIVISASIIISGLSCLSYIKTKSSDESKLGK
jgi:hypothetical protein